MAESFLERFRRGERPSIDEYAAKYPELADEIRELLPALVQLERDFSVGGATGSFDGGARVADPEGRPAAARRLHDPPRGRPGRDGGRLRGGAAVARAARRPEGAALAGDWATRRSSSGSAWRPARRRGCTTPTSCPSSASASTTGRTTSPCSSSAARASTRSSPSSRRLRRGGSARGRAGHALVAASRRRSPCGLLTGRWPAASTSRPPGRRADPDARPGPADRRGRPAASTASALIPGPELHGVVGAAVLPPGRPDRPPGGRGAGLRPRPGHPPPRHQAVEPPDRHPGHRLGHRLRPGQGRGLRRPDADRRHRRHAPLHGPRAVRGPVRPAERRLRPGRHALRAADARARLRRRQPRQARSTGSSTTRRPRRGSSTGTSRATWRRSS